ncbi:MAG: DUF3108 domain-containing protein [Blastocatellia bacterium]
MLALSLLSAVALAMRLLPTQVPRSTPQQPPQQAPRKTTEPLTQPPKPEPIRIDPPDSGPDKKGILTTGERLNFNVSWAGFVTAARVELEVNDRGRFFGREGYYLRTRVETIGYARTLLADLDHQYNTYVDLNGLLPHRLENSLRQGRNRTEEITIVDQTSNRARFADGSEMPVPQGICDLPAMLQALRFRDLRAGSSHKFSVLYGKTVADVDAQVKANERVITQAGAYDAIRVDFVVKNAAVDVNKYRVRAWFSNDKQRLPVLITARPPFGEVRVELSSLSQVVRPHTEIGRNVPPTGHPDVPVTQPPVESVFQAVDASDIPMDKLPFAVGERLAYDISWGNFVSVGKANFSVRRQGRLNNRHVFEFVGEVTSTGAARNVLAVNDQFLSYVDAEKLTPIRTDLQLREGRRNKQITADYDAVMRAFRLSSGTDVPVTPGTLDLVSLFYAVRARELKPGEVFQFDFLDANHKPKSLIFRVVREEKIDSPLGPQDTLQIDIARPDGVALVAQAWVTRDPRHLPVYIAARLRIGELRFQLSNMAGAK